MRDEVGDFELMVNWRNRPHVREWWDPDDPPVTLQDVMAKYQSRTDPDETTTACVIELGARPIGYLQFYPWDDYSVEAEECGWVPRPGWWGIDQFIGEADLIGRGLGTRIVSLICSHLAVAVHARAVALMVDQNNHRAIRCYEKVGMRNHGTALDTDTRSGVRVASWLMVKTLNDAGRPREPESSPGS
jgi:aminoglycoside 6'-N-acetyltransferase